MMSQTASTSVYKGMIVNKSMECTDKLGCPFAIDGCGSEHLAKLVDMYNEFYPKAAAQGLPPIDDVQRSSWIEKLLKCGRNFLVRQDGKLVGHAALVPDFDKMDAEYVIFIDHRYRNRGLGSKLTSYAAENARKWGLESLCLTVEAHNLPAIRVYKKAGFKFCDEYGSERTMILPF